MAVYFYMSDSNDGWRNLAIDSFFLENLHKDSIVLYLYVNANAVIIGKNQNAWRECNLIAMEKDGVQLVRRHTGGGAVFHDSQNLNFSFIMSNECYDVKRQMGVIQKMVSNLGMTAYLSGRNDILIDEKKFSGNAFAASRSMKAHHGTILVKTDLSRLSGYLNVSEKKMNAKGIKSVKSRVCNLGDFDENITVSSVVRLLQQEFRSEYGEYEEFKFTEQDRVRVEELYAVQSSWEWRFGHSPAFDYQIDERFSFGEMQLLFQIKDGIIKDLFVFTDALDTELVEVIQNRLIGARFTPEDISESLIRDTSRVELREVAEYIGGITF